METRFSDLERADMIADLMSSQEPTALTLYRQDAAGEWHPLQPQDVVRITGRGTSIATPPASEALNQRYVNVYFTRPEPFDVAPGDMFDLDGHKGGKITGVERDPTLGLLRASATLPVGAPI